MASATVSAVAQAIAMNPQASIPGQTFVTFRNTHSNFADIIQPEIFEPELSKLDFPPFAQLHTLPCVSTHFQTIPTFLEPSDHVPRTTPRPCLQILHSITLTLIVFNCLSVSCCTMIHDIASHAPSVCSFRSIVFVLCASLT